MSADSKKTSRLEELAKLVRYYVLNATTRAASAPLTPIYSLAVTRKPRSGKPAELLNHEDISSEAIVKTIKEELR